MELIMLITDQISSVSAFLSKRETYYRKEKRATKLYYFPFFNSLSGTSEKEDFRNACVLGTNTPTPMANED